MMDLMLLIPLVAVFLVVSLLMPFWIRKAHQIGLVWDDMNKLNAKKVAGSGGIIVVLGFVLGVLLFVAYRIFFLNTFDFLIEIFALLNVILLVSGVGFVDSLFGWQHGGLSRRSRLILIAISAVPLIVINAGHDTMSFPFFGEVNMGLIYPLIIIPLGIVGATTTFNFLAGFNGLEAGQGIILLFGISLISFFTNNSWLAIIALCMIASLIAFLKFNITPAKVFPGDVLTYSIGSLVAAIAILGNCEKIAIFFFLPYIIEAILKLRGSLIKHSFGKPKKDGSLELRYSKIYGLTHVTIWAMQKFGVKPTEKRVVYTLWTFQALFIVLGLWIFREGIFYA
jgi:UDP-N-acetylglucosamine--dolichyl-phosphate N-acetylglucosaminephosphotransferase